MFISFFFCTFPLLRMAEKANDDDEEDNDGGGYNDDDTWEEV